MKQAHKLICSHKCGEYNEKTQKSLKSENGDHFFDIFGVVHYKFVPEGQ